MARNLLISLRDLIRDASDFVALLLLDRRESRSIVPGVSAVRREAEASDASH